MMRELFSIYIFVLLHDSCHGKPQTSHVMLTGRGANLFAESVGFSTVTTHALVSEFERKKWECHKTYAAGVLEDFNTQWYAFVSFSKHDFSFSINVDLSTMNSEEIKNAA